MATSLTAATLTITIVEAITLNGQDKGATNTLAIASVTEVSQRIVEIPTSEIIILAFQATNPGAGTFDEADVRYIRLTNKDSLNHITLIFRSQNNGECAHLLDAGQTFILPGDNSDGVANVHDASASALSVSLDDLVDITAQANGSACDLEYFVAGV
jgi:hypothetical protein